MTQPKQISTSLKTLLDNPLVLGILDRSSNVGVIANITTQFWDYDLFSRKPSPAYDEYGVFTGTDLDLACFLYSLSGRGAVINIPNYKSATQKKARKDQRLVSKTNRHGELLKVIGNQNFFKFNISIMDQNVIGADKVGDFRTFSITDYDGKWYDGWDLIEFVPTINENKFITENALWSGNKIQFKNFIHPNRWTSFFGQYYVISKLMIERLTEEAKHLNSEIKTMISEGIHFPSAAEGIQTHEYEEPGQTKSVSFNVFEAKIHIPEMGLKGEFPKLKHNQKNLVELYDKMKRLNKYKEALTFMTRATEYAHSTNKDRMPAWIKNTKWEEGFVEPGKRTKWTRLKLFQPEVGKHAVSILKRTYSKAARVDIGY
jgi:hypothetical protein